MRVVSHNAGHMQIDPLRPSLTQPVDPLALTSEPSSDEEDEAEPPPPQHGGQRTADGGWALWRAMDLSVQVLRRWRR